MSPAKVSGYNVHEIYYQRYEYAYHRLLFPELKNNHNNIQISLAYFEGKHTKCPMPLQGGGCLKILFLFIYFQFVCRENSSSQTKTYSVHN